MDIKEQVKNSLRKNQYINAVYSSAQRHWFESRYYRVREEYHRKYMQRGSPDLSPDQLFAQARKRVSERNYAVTPKPKGEVHSFVFMPTNWPNQDQIVEPLHAFGKVTRYDYCTSGITLQKLSRSYNEGEKNRDIILRQTLELFEDANKKEPVDWVYAYALGWDFSKKLLDEIHSRYRVPTVAITMDDKNWWTGVVRGDRESALVRILPHFDITWTTARMVLPWYCVEGGRAIFLPEAVNVDYYRPMEEVTQDIDVGFVGSRLGYREEIFAKLYKAGVPVQVYGANWPNGTIPNDEMVHFFNRCKINLGLGDMHFSKILTNLKGRDFEATATGRSLYCTAYNSDLADCFHIGKELVCYRGVDELIEQIRFYLRKENQAQRKQIAALGRKRCIADHQWEQRYAYILSMLGILK